MRLSLAFVALCSLSASLPACTSNTAEPRDAGPREDAGEEPPDAAESACWSWPANIVRGSSAWLEGERALLVRDALFEPGPRGWIVQQVTPGMFDIRRGDGWTALLVRGATGEPDWMLYRRDGEEEWRRVDAPEELFEGPWDSVTHTKTHVYVRNKRGTIARFDGTDWEEVAVGEQADSVGIAVVGDVIYDWHGYVDVFEDGAFHRLPDMHVAAPWGDGEQAFLRPDPRTLVRVTPAGSETLPAVPPSTDVVRAKGDHVAIQTNRRTTDVYRLVAGEWQLVATERTLLAVDADGTLLLGQKGTAVLVAPDGSERVLGVDTEPVGPLLGESREALWTLASRGSLLRLAEDHWEPVTETAGLSIVSAWRSPSGVLFLATVAEVYRLTDAGLEPLPAPGLGETRALLGRSDEELYRSSIGTDLVARTQRWDGSAWTELEQLAVLAEEMPTEERENIAFGGTCLIGTSGFLGVRRYTGAPSTDPIDAWEGLASNGGAWERALHYNGYDVSGLRVMQLGDPAAPIALFSTYKLSDSDRRLYYDRPDPEHPSDIVESGFFEHNFIGSIAGKDLDHMVGVVGGVARFMLRDGDEWQTLGEGALHFGVNDVKWYSPTRVGWYGSDAAAWYGSDAVGVASIDGATICER